MATATATLVVTGFTGDVARPPGHAGWNNPVGDPAWVFDYDFYRRVQLVCSGADVGTVVNWECYDDTLQFQTTATLTTGTSYTGTSATPYGALVNNSTTWTVWASNGSVAANTIKYVDTRSPCFSKLRANGPRVQLVLGARKKVGSGSTAWTVAAFLPGAGRIPSATATITIAAPSLAQLPIATPTAAPETRKAPEDEPEVRMYEDESEPEAVESRAKPEKEDKPPKKAEPKGKK